MTLLTLLAIAVAALLAGILFRSILALSAYFAFRGKRLATCPETHKTKAIEVAARKAALTALVGEPVLRVDRCSRWPERHDCGQECLQQVATDPDNNCLVWNVVSNWYAGKTCAFCHKRFGRLEHPEQAAVTGADQKTVEWDRFRPELLLEVFSTFKPVCWDCHIAHTFRQVHPKLLTDRHRDIHLPR